MTAESPDPREEPATVEAEAIPTGATAARAPLARPAAPAQFAAPPRRGGRGLLIFFLFVLLFFLAGSMLMNLGLMASLGSSSSVERPLTERHVALSQTGTNKIAIIEVSGTITETDGGFVKRQIDQVRADDDVKAVIVRIDSPGGTVFASDYQYHHLKKLAEEREIPLVVSMGSLAASGGYYVAMAVGDTERTIFAEPTTWSGSIGVIMPHYDVSGLLTDWKIEDDSIVSHRLKGMGSPSRPMTEEERKIFQQLVTDSFDRFKEVVRSGRPKFAENEAALDAVATGQVFTTPQAMDNGLVDEEGFLEDAIDRAVELAAIDPDNTEVVKYTQPVGLMDALMFGAQGRAAMSGRSLPGSLDGLLDLATPRAYYLWTWPAAAGLGAPN
ncbi:MAG: signal peptide peptidase SppA [Pirellulales bacterium]